MKYRPEEEIEYDEAFFTSGKSYDKFAHCETQGIFKEQVDMLIEVIGSIEGKSLLDVGGALGWFAKRCIDEGAYAYCQEVSLWACKNSPIPNKMRCCDAGDEILAMDDSFDIVTCIECLEHIDNVKQALREISRVLKKGGLFFCIVGLSETYSHIHIGTPTDWCLMLDSTPGLMIDKELTEKIRNTRCCTERNWASKSFFLKGV